MRRTLNIYDGTTLVLPRGEWLDARFREARLHAWRIFDSLDQPWISIAAYDFPPAEREVCNRIDCPVEPSGLHSTNAMSGLIAASYYGPRASVPRVDGLGTGTIIHVKAHAVACHGESNLVTYQHGLVRPGEPNSIGGVLVQVPLPSTGDDDPYFRFIVACSGGPKIKDNRVAEDVGSFIGDAMLSEGVLPLALPAGETFIHGLTGDQVARFVSGAGE